MQLTLATDQNRPIVYKMIRFDSATEPRNTIEVKNVASLADAEIEAGADWVAGKAMGIECRERCVGDIVELGNGKISIVITDTQSVVFEASEYTGTLPNISVDQTILDAIQYKPNRTRIQSIVNGDMTLWL